MLSFMRMFRGTFHMMFPRLNWSSQAIVVLVVRPSPRPAVWSVRFPPPKKNAVGIISSPRHSSRDHFDPRVPRRLERLDPPPEGAQGRVVGFRVRRLADHRDDGRGPVEGLEHRPVVLVEPVELLLLDAGDRKST